MNWLLPFIWIIPCVNIALLSLRSADAFWIWNIGKIVAERALGLKMVVLGYDPYVSKEDLLKLGIEPASLDEIYNRMLVYKYYSINDFPR